MRQLKYIFGSLILLICVSAHAQFGNSGPFPDNITIRNDGTYLEGTGKIVDLRENIAATYDALTSTYHINASGDEASDITVDSSNFDKVLSVTDTDVQTALETIDDAFQTEYPPNCTTGDDWCMLFSGGLVKLYVGSSLQSQWPITAEEYHLLLDDGSGGYKLLLDDGVGGYFLIIK